jgi:hypothetical protein
MHPAFCSATQSSAQVADRPSACLSRVPLPYLCCRQNAITLVGLACEFNRLDMQVYRCDRSEIGHGLREAIT